MVLGASLCIDVIISFDALKNACLTVEDCMINLDGALPGWYQGINDTALIVSNNYRQKAWGLINQLEYIDGQDPREILLGAGVFAASDKTLQVIQHLNECKNTFKASMLALKSAKIPISHPELVDYFETTLSKRPGNIKQTLRKIGLSRLHLKQCYRLIPCLAKRPESISWTWANTRAITRISVQEALMLLLKQGNDAGILLQINKLNALAQDEPLAIVQTLAPHLRANIVTEENGLLMRSMVKGSVPLFYPPDSSFSLPNIKKPLEKTIQDRQRMVRSDVRLEQNPFLPAIRAHRYIQ